MGLAIDKKYQPETTGLMKIHSLIHNKKVFLEINIRTGGF